MFFRILINIILDYMRSPWNDSTAVSENCLTMAFTGYQNFLPSTSAEYKASHLFKNNSMWKARDVCSYGYGVVIYILKITQTNICEKIKCCRHIWATVYIIFIPFISYYNVLWWFNLHSPSDWKWWVLKLTFFKLLDIFLLIISYILILGEYLNVLKLLIKESMNKVG